MIPKLEITTTNETLQFDLPEGEIEVAQIRLNGEEIHDIHKVAMLLQQQSRSWIGLGVFLALSAVVALVLGSWIVHRLQSLPSDTAQIQSMIDNQHPPVFAVGNRVSTHAGAVGVVTKVNRGASGNWIYLVGEVWVGQSGLTYINHSAPVSD